VEIGTLGFVMASARAVMASLALSYEVESGVSVNETELKCMAENIYFEGRAEPMMGKIAIGHVVMNRIEDKRFPDTICDVGTPKGPCEGIMEDEERSYTGQRGQDLLS